MRGQSCQMGVIKIVKIEVQVTVRDFEEEQAVDGLEEEEEGRIVFATGATGGGSFNPCQVERSELSCWTRPTSCLQIV